MFGLSRYIDPAGSGASVQKEAMEQGDLDKNVVAVVME